MEDQNGYLLDTGQDASYSSSSSILNDDLDPFCNLPVFDGYNILLDSFICEIEEEARYIQPWQDEEFVNFILDHLEGDAWIVARRYVYNNYLDLIQLLGCHFNTSLLLNKLSRGMPIYNGYNMPFPSFAFTVNERAQRVPQGYYNVFLDILWNSLRDEAKHIAQYYGFHNHQELLDLLDHHYNHKHYNGYQSVFSIKTVKGNEMSYAKPCRSKKIEDKNTKYLSTSTNEISRMKGQLQYQAAAIGLLGILLQKQNEIKHLEPQTRTCEKDENMVVDEVKPSLNTENIDNLKLDCGELSESEGILNLHKQASENKSSCIIGAEFIKLESMDDTKPINGPIRILQRVVPRIEKDHMQRVQIEKIETLQDQLHCVEESANEGQIREELSPQDSISSNAFSIIEKELKYDEVSLVKAKSSQQFCDSTKGAYVKSLNSNNYEIGGNTDFTMLKEAIDSSSNEQTGESDENKSKIRDKKEKKKRLKNSENKQIKKHGEENFTKVMMLEYLGLQQNDNNKSKGSISNSILKWNIAVPLIDKKGTELLDPYEKLQLPLARTEDLRIIIEGMDILSMGFIVKEFDSDIFANLQMKRVINHHTIQGTELIRRKFEEKACKFEMKLHGDSLSKSRRKLSLEVDNILIRVQEGSTNAMFKVVDTRSTRVVTKIHLLLRKLQKIESSSLNVCKTALDNQNYMYSGTLTKIQGTQKGQVLQDRLSNHLQEFETGPFLILKTHLDKTHNPWFGWLTLKDHEAPGSKSSMGRTLTHLEWPSYITSLMHTLQ